MKKTTHRWRNYGQEEKSHSTNEREGSYTSHTSDIELEVTDINCLEDAVKSIPGLEFLRGQKTFKQFGGQQGRCDHAIRVANNSRAFEIGVSETGRPGRHRLQTDFYGGGYGLEELVGPNANKLKQAYTVAYSKKQWKKKGFKVRTTVDAQGFIDVIATRRT